MVRGRCWGGEGAGVDGEGAGVDGEGAGVGVVRGQVLGW